jgi:membrane-bound serine protease (ClpP class)
VPALAAALLGSVLLGPLASAGEPTTDDGADAGDDVGYVQVIEVSGLIDPVELDYITAQLDDADRAGAVGVIIQLNSGGAAISDAEVRDLAVAIEDATTAVAIWVGPSGAKAEGAAAELVGVAELTGMAPGTRLGDIGDGAIPEDDLRAGFAEAADVIRDDTVGDEEAVALGLADVAAPTVGDFAFEIEGFETRDVEGSDQREPVTSVSFTKLPLTARLFHTVASPPAAYLLLVIGMALLLFELFTAGVGIAGVVGATFVLLGSYGLGVLPTRPWAVALLVLSFLAFGVDVQTGIPRFWSVVGAVCFTVGTFWLYDGLAISWVTLVFAFGGMALFVLTAMPAMVRTRFSTPTIGREDLIGEVGTALTDISPEGTVSVRDAPWRALVNRATPIAEGDEVRVAAIEGLVLEVEPLEGAARDYREPKTKRSWQPTQGEAADRAADGDGGAGSPG